MAYSYYTYTGNGSQTQFPVAFDYIRREHVFATVAGSPATFAWVNSTTIQMDAAPANGATVRVYRQTPLTAPLVDFTDGATLVAADLDTNAKQSIYTQQELDDSVVEGLAGVIPNGDKGDITTSVNGTVWTIDSGAVVEAKIGTGAVVEAKIGTGAVSAAKIASGAFTDSVSSTSTTTIATPNSVKTAYDLANTANTTAGTANTTANAALPKAGGTMTGVITYDSAQPRLVRATAVATTSGTSVSFTSIPNWVKRITVLMDSISATGSDYILIQLGDSGGFETTGYVSNTGFTTFTPAVASGGFSSTSGIVVTGGASANLSSGSLVLNNISGNRWITTGHYNFSNLNTAMGWTVGEKTLTDTLDRVRIVLTGSDSFDSGSVNIMYEG